MCIRDRGCTVAPLDPKAAVTVLYKDELENGTNIAADTAKLAARYAADVCSAAAAVEAGLADMAVPAAGVRAAVVSALDMQMCIRDRPVTTALELDLSEEDFPGYTVPGTVEARITATLQGRMLEIALDITADVAFACARCLEERCV